MTIRDAIANLVGGTTQGEPVPSAAAALADEGFADVPPELFGTAVTHYADTAPIDQADALAPIAARVGPVPFEEGDLPPLSQGVPSEGDPFQLFDAIAPTASADGDVDFDFEPESVQPESTEPQSVEPDSAPPEPAHQTEANPAAEDGDFGAGNQTDDATFDELAALGADEGVLADFATGETGSADDFQIDLIDEPATNLFSADFSDADDPSDDIDPDDLDLAD